MTGGASSRPSWLARWSYLLVLAALLAVYVWTARKHDLGSAIRRDVAASGGTLIDLPKSVPFPWSRVCILGPQSDAKATSALLGFAWDSNAHSDVLHNDDVTLLVFANKNVVVGAVDYSRELAPMAGKCYPRAEARFPLLQ